MIHRIQTTFLVSKVTYRVPICMTYIQHSNVSKFLSICSVWQNVSICSPKSSLFLTYLPNQNQLVNSSDLVTSTGKIQAIFNASLSLTTQHIQSVYEIWHFMFKMFHQHPSLSLDIILSQTLSFLFFITSIISQEVSVCVSSILYLPVHFLR